jgi:hypothetical protein
VGVKSDERRTFAPGSMGPIRGARGGARGGPARVCDASMADGVLVGWSTARAIVTQESVEM